MRSSALLLIAALAGSGFGQSYNTFKGFLDSLPSCARSCGTTAVQKIADGCGGDGAKIECICNGPGDVTLSEAQEDLEKGGACAAEKCDGDDVLSFTDDLLELTQVCIRNFNTTASTPLNPSDSDSSSSSSSSPSSGSNQLVAPALALGLVGFGLALAI